MKSYIFAFLLTNCALCLQSNQPVETTPPLENLSGAETQAVLAINLDRGDTLCSYNIEKEMTPASVTKLFTTVAALKILGADYKFATRRVLLWLWVAVTLRSIRNILPETTLKNLRKT